MLGLLIPHTTNLNEGTTVTALIFTVLIFHEFTNWTLFAILFSRICIDIRPFKVGNSYYLEYSRLYFHESLTFS